MSGGLRLRTHDLVNVMLNVAIDFFKSWFDYQFLFFDDGPGLNGLCVA
jgi:hypothetical protein